MESWRTAGDYHIVELLFLNGVYDEDLTRVRTHVNLVFVMYDSFMFGKFFSCFLNIHSSSNVYATVANENACSFHFFTFFFSLLIIFFIYGFFAVIISFIKGHYVEVKKSSGN